MTLLESIDVAVNAELERELHRRILEAVPGGIVYVTVDGAVRSANAEACRILGLAYDELTRRYTADFDPETLNEDGSPCPVEAYPVSRVLATGEPQPPLTIGIRQRSGAISWAVFRAIPVKNPETQQLEGAVVTFLDITERRAAEDRLRKSEATLRTLFDSAPNRIALLDTEGRLVLLNRTFTGVPSEALAGRHALDFVGEEQRPVLQAALERTLVDGEPAHCEFEATFATGRLVYSVELAPLRVGGKILGAVAVASDVTEQKRLERQILISDRMASVGTLAASVAHEINNPLTYVLANLGLLLSGSAVRGDPPEVEAAIRDACEGAERIRRVVKDLGTFSGGRDAERTRVEVREVIDSAVRMASSEIKFRARLVREELETPQTVVTNPSRLGQVVLNLLVNAGQAIEEGKVQENEIRIVTRCAEDGRLAIDVTDTGRGIPPELLETIFEPFVTTKRDSSGTGLGLYICQNIVTSLGGELRVKSTVGVGSTFTVLLPSDGDGGTAPRPPEDAGVASRRLRILVVDDEPHIRRVLRQVLASHEVVETGSGRQALALLERETFDVILCDLIMPDVTGMDVFEEIQRTRPEVSSRMVFMTGGAFTGRSSEFVAKLRHPLLQKPLSVDQLRSVVARVGDAGS